MRARNNKVNIAIQFVHTGLNSFGNILTLKLNLQEALQKRGTFLNVLHSIRYCNTFGRQLVC